VHASRPAELNHRTLRNEESGTCPRFDHRAIRISNLFHPTGTPDQGTARSLPTSPVALKARSQVWGILTGSGGGSCIQDRRRCLGGDFPAHSLSGVEGMPSVLKTEASSVGTSGIDCTEPLVALSKHDATRRYLRFPPPTQIACPTVPLVPVPDICGPSSTPATSFPRFFSQAVGLSGEAV
jgi:hypothetical protein